MAKTLRHKPEEALRIGTQMVELATQDKAKLDARLPAGHRDGMTEDFGILGESSSGAVAARVQKKASTQTQDTVAERLRVRVQAVREACKLTDAPAYVLKELGVGHPMNVKVVLSVVSGAQLIIETYAKHPDVLRAAGVLPEDVESITGLRKALRSADDGQEKKKVSSKDKTANRKAVQARVEAGIYRILAAADLALVDQPERLALYHALIPTKTRPAKKPPTP